MTGAEWVTNLLELAVILALAAGAVLLVAEIVGRLIVRWYQRRLKRWWTSAADDLEDDSC